MQFRVGEFKLFLESKTPLRIFQKPWIFSSEKVHLYRLLHVISEGSWTTPKFIHGFCIKNSYPLGWMPRKLKWCRALIALVWPGLIQTKAVADWQHSSICAPQTYLESSLQNLSNSSMGFSILMSYFFCLHLYLSYQWAVIYNFLIFLFFVCVSVKSLPSPSIILCSSFRSCSSRSRDSWELVFLFCNMFSMFFPISSKSLSSAELLSVSVDKISVDDKTLKRQNNVKLKRRGNISFKKSWKNNFSLGKSRKLRNQP